MSSLQTDIDSVLRAIDQAQPQAASDTVDVESVLSMIDEQVAPPGPRTAIDQPDLERAAASQYEGMVEAIPYSPLEPIPIREVARGVVQAYNDAAQTIGTPGMRAQFIRSLMSPFEWFVDTFTPGRMDPVTRETVGNYIARQASMALEPAGSGLTTEDLPSEIIAMRGARAGLAAGQEEGIRGDIARGVGQSLPQFAALAATGGGGAPVAVAAQAPMVLGSFGRGMQAAIDDFEQERADAAREGRPLPEFDLAKFRQRALISGGIETGVELVGAGVGGRAIGATARRIAATPAARKAMRAIGETGAARAARNAAGRPAAAAYRAATRGADAITPGFLRGVRSIVATSAVEEGAEELATGILNAPFTYAPLSEDLSQALYSSLIGAGAGGAGGAVTVTGVAARRGISNLRDSFRPETDAERIAMQRHEDALKRRIDWGEDLDKAQQERLAVTLQSVNGMDSDERGRFLRELLERRGSVEENVERLLEQRRQAEQVFAGIDEADAAGTELPGGVSPETARDIAQAQVADIDEQLADAARDKVMAEAEYNAVAEKMLDMPKDARQVAPEAVLDHVSRSGGTALEQTQAPKNGRRLQSDMENLGMKVVWFRPKDGTFSPAFHSMTTRGTIFLNADADMKQARAKALEEMFHDIQMFRPDIAMAYMRAAGIDAVYQAGVEYATQGVAESERTARLDEAAIDQVLAVIDQRAGGRGEIAPTQARRGAARLEQEGAANLFSAAAADMSERSLSGAFLRAAARMGIAGRDARTAVMVLDTVARAAAVERVEGRQGPATLSPLARTLMWAGDLNISYARPKVAKPAPEAMPTKPKQPEQFDEFASSIVKEVGLTPAEARSTVLEYMTGQPGRESFRTGKQAGIKGIIKFLHARRMASGLRVLDLEKAADRKVLAKMMAAEAVAAMRSEGNALTWYDDVIKDMLAKLSVTYPELATDLRARNALIIALAITSQGQNVKDNLDDALKVYEQYRSNVQPDGRGQFPVFGTGKEGAAMRSNFIVANEMMDRYGPEVLSRFLRTPFTVRQLRDAGFKIEGELVDEQVLGSSIFGPKIGFGFMSNLFGNFDPVTMDMWFMRTIGRLMGRLPKFRQDLFDRQMGRLRESLAEAGTNGLYADSFPAALVAAAADPAQPDKAIELATAVTKAHEKDFKTNRADFDSGARIKTNLVNASASILSSLSDPNDAPSSGGQRNLLRKVVREAVAIASSVTKTDITNASFQALIWYPEQYLYSSLGAKLRVIGENYSNAATELLIEKGIDRGTIEDAVRRRREPGPAGVRGVDGAAVAAGPEAAGGEPGAARPLDVPERAAFLQQQPGAIAKQWPLPETSRTVDARVRNRVNTFAAIRFARANRQGGGTAWSYRPERGDAGRSRNLKSIRAKYVATWTPGVGLSTLLVRTKNKAPKVYELEAGAESAAVFHRLINGAKGSQKFGACVFVYPEADYGSMRLFVTKDGESGFALKPDGDIVSVFSVPGNGEFRGLMETAIAAGGRKLDCFDTVLPDAYAPHGFKAASRLPWSNDQAPSDWNKETFSRFNNGEPDVVFMSRDDAYIGEYAPEDGQRFTDYGAAVAEQEQQISFGRGPPVRPLSSFTPEWRAWFGNSKVLDSEGNPLVVYHGTQAAEDFQAFDEEGNFTPDRGGLIAFFSTSPVFASNYASRMTDRRGETPIKPYARTIPVYLRITNPFDFRNEIDAEMAVDSFLEAYGPPQGFKDWTFKQAVLSGTWDAIENNEFIEHLRNRGHDGIVLYEGNAINYGIFRSNQAKAIFNERPTMAPEISFARAAEDPEVAALRQQIAELTRQMRDVQNVTAAQRANALREVRQLERRLAAAELLASQKVGQAQRARARAEREAQVAETVKSAAQETITALNTELDEAEATIRRLKGEVRAARRAADITALEAKVDRAASFAYQIGRREGLVAGQVAGQAQIRRQEVRPLAARAARASERIALLETRLADTRTRLREAQQTIRTDAAAAERAINFAYGMGLAKGRIQGRIQGRIEILRRMRAREDALQRRLFDLRELMESRMDFRDVVQRLAREAAESLPVRLRGPLAARAASVRTLGQANRVAVEAMKLAANAEVAGALARINRVRRRMNRRGMRWATRQQIDALLAQADAALRQANRRRILAMVQTTRTTAGRPAGPAVVNAVSIYAQVIDAANMVQQAELIYEQEDAAWTVERDVRVQRYADLRNRLVQNVRRGRTPLAPSTRADRPPLPGLLRPIQRANSDIYTLGLEVEGTQEGVINEMLEAAQAGKGAAALEHASLMRQLQPALLAAGYSGIDEYAMQNGMMGDVSAQLVTVRLGGQNRTMPLGVVLSIAAMDPETQVLFGDVEPNAQGIKLRGSESTLTIYPTRQEIDALRAGLTPQQRGLYEAMKSILETQVRDRALEAIYRVEGDQPPIIESYWPRIRYTQDVRGETADVLRSAGAMVRGALTSVGFANAREGGSQPLLYDDAFRTWDRHLQVALDMIHMAQPYRDAVTVLNDREISEEIDRRHGAGATDALLALFANGVGATRRTNSTLIDRMTSNVTGAILAMRPRTWAKIVVGGQIRLASEIPSNYLASGVAAATMLVRSPEQWRDRRDEIHAINGYFLRRHSLQFRNIVSGTLSQEDSVRATVALRSSVTALRAAGQAVAANRIEEAVKAFAESSRGGVMAIQAFVDFLRLMDEQIMLVAVEARLAEVRDEGVLTGPDALREAALRAERDFRRTQNASDEFDETVFNAQARMSGDRASRLLFPFSSDPLKARNQLRRAYLSGQGRLRATAAVGGNIAASTIIGTASIATTATMVSLVASLFGGDDDPDKEMQKEAKKAAERIPAAIASEVLSSTLGYSGIVLSWILDGYAYGRPEMGAPLVFRPAADVLRESTKDRQWSANAIMALLAALQYANFPAYGMVRFITDLIPEREKTPREKVEERIKRRIERLQEAGSR